MQRLDAVVIGTGPAGLEAALNLKIRNKDFMLFGPKGLSQKLILAPKIDNYLGLPGITGKELGEKYLSHIASMGIDITDRQVSMVYSMGSFFSIATSSETYETKTVILATGTLSGKPFPGERELLGRGVGYCATCDAPLYRGKTVAIIGYGDESVIEANFVSEIASTVYYIPAKKAELKPNGKVRVLEKKAVEIQGDKKVERLVLDDHTLEVDAVFILRDTIAPDSLVPGLELEGGFVRVDASMRTNLPGCFAAGDCTGKPHQYMRAAGQGQVAALSAAYYIDQQ